MLSVSQTYQNGNKVLLLEILLQTLLLEFEVKLKYLNIMIDSNKCNNSVNQIIQF